VQATDIEGMIHRMVCLLFFVLVVSPFARAETFIVSHGDTPSQIAASHSIPLALLKKANPGFDWIHLKTGDKVLVPGRYQVKPGDTLYSLGRQWHVEVALLLDWNHLGSPDALKSGQTLYFPEAPQGATPSSPSSVTPEKNSENPSHPVSTASLFWPVASSPHKESDRLKSVTFASTGEEFRSVASGTVVFLGEFRGVGRVLLVQSIDGLIYAYGNFASAEVAFGQSVIKGTALGRTSSQEGQRLRFFIFRNKDALDPFVIKR